MAEVYEEIYAELLRMNSELLNRIDLMSAQIDILLAKLDEADKQHEKDAATIRELTLKIEELASKKTKKDSHNSSQPPSSDGYSKPAPKSLREKSGKKQGGQKGHEGHGMKITREPDKVEILAPKECQGCPMVGMCKGKCRETHYTCDVEVKTTITAYKVEEVVCPLRNNRVLTGEFPAEAKAPIQYGQNVKALACALNTAGYVSIDRIAKFLNGLGLAISAGTVQNFIKECKCKVSDAVNAIRNKVAVLKVLNVDETGMRVGGRLHWLHCICDSQWSYFSFHQKRGSEAMEDIGIIPGLDGNTLIHDFWKSYLDYTNVDHAFCNAHIERELVYAYESTGQKWAKELKELLSGMCRRRNELMFKGTFAFPSEELDIFYAEYDRLVKEGIEKNPIPTQSWGKRGRKARGKTRCLADRLNDYKDELLRFVKDWSIPFTNNEAERSIRFVKVKSKISGGFRTKEGADGFADIMSYISTANKHGVFAYEALFEAFKGNSLMLISSWA